MAHLAKPYAIFVVSLSFFVDATTGGTKISGTTSPATVLVQTECPEVEMPVCATKNGVRKTYGNDCKARRDGATDITPGACETKK